MDTTKVKMSVLKRKDNKIDRLEKELKISIQCERALVRFAVKTCTLLEVLGDKFNQILTDEEKVYKDAIMQDYENILSAYSIDRTGVSKEQQEGKEVVEGLKPDGE